MEAAIYGISTVAGIQAYQLRYPLEMPWMLGFLGAGMAFISDMYFGSKEKRFAIPAAVSVSVGVAAYGFDVAGLDAGILAFLVFMSTTMGFTVYDEIRLR